MHEKKQTPNDLSARISLLLGGWLRAKRKNSDEQRFSSALGSEDAVHAFVEVRVGGIEESAADVYLLDAWVLGGGEFEVLPEADIRICEALPQTTKIDSVQFKVRAPRADPGKAVLACCRARIV